MPLHVDRPDLQTSQAAPDNGVHSSTSSHLTDRRLPSLKSLVLPMPHPLSRPEPGETLSTFAVDLTFLHASRVDLHLHRQRGLEVFVDEEGLPPSTTHVSQSLPRSPITTASNITAHATLPLAELIDHTIAASNRDEARTWPNQPSLHATLRTNGSRSISRDLRDNTSRDQFQGHRQTLHRGGPQTGYNSGMSTAQSIPGARLYTPNESLPLSWMSLTVRKSEVETGAAGGGRGGGHRNHEGQSREENRVGIRY